MKVLVLGARGQLGSDLLRIDAAAHGCEWIPLHREQLDLADCAAIPAALDRYTFHALVNCTGYNRVDQAEHDAANVMQLNAHAVRCLAECCKARNARFVQISTDFVFSGAQSQPYTETAPTAPVNVYGASKALGETMALSAWRDTVVMRTASLFGIAGARERGGNFVESILRSARQGKRISVIDDVRMSPTATADLARMIVALLRHAAPPGIYHAVNSGSATWYEFAKEIVRQAGVRADLAPIPRAEYPQAAKRPPNSALDNGKIAAVAGTIPPWQDALRRYCYAKGL
ncbi:MAG: dTDP-4-dehydrorhamnose reductase [Deltaproteobacteria bacterium]|nr:dTDP-4-dehydrorhamnose reductase [Deltaproteobacteria bacterium]